MDSEIIYVCNSVNNKNVRKGELEILEKHEDQLYFEFGENQMNIKKRYYNDLETLNKDFNALLKLKNKENIKTEKIEEDIEEQEEPKKNFKKFNKKSDLL